MNSSRLSPRGTSLIEAMAALVVFSVGILGVMQMNVLASQQNNLARSQTIASKIARDVADSFERLPFDHPLLDNATALLLNDPEFLNMDNARRADEAAGRRGADGGASADGRRGRHVHLRGTQRLLPGGLARRCAWPTRIASTRWISSASSSWCASPLRAAGMKQVNTWAVKYDVSRDDRRPETPLEL